MATQKHTHGEPLPPGVHDLTQPAAATKGSKAAAHTGFYRVHVFTPSAPEPGAPDHVVAARDEMEAEAVAFKELGIRSVDKTVNQVEITPVPETAFVEAQAKRLGVDLRQQKDDEGKLTWAPPGHKLQKTCYVSERGEVLDKPEEK